MADTAANTNGEAVQTLPQLGFWAWATGTLVVAAAHCRHNVLLAASLLCYTLPSKSQLETREALFFIAAVAAAAALCVQLL